jgi:plasmid stabilization system protein ParE
MRAAIGFIAQENPAAARRMRNLIEFATLPLAEHPVTIGDGR